MKEYFLQTFDVGDPNLVAVYDDLPLWSAPFGLLLLNSVKMRPNINILDIGCGAGFPLLELAQRFGDSCQVYGIDLWGAALQRVKQKIDVLQIQNVNVINCDVVNMPFLDGFFDLVVSNVGINNFENLEQAFGECFRVCRTGAQIMLTTNLPETMLEFYQVYEEILRESGKDDEISKLKHHVSTARKSLGQVKALLEKSGFQIVRTVEEQFQIKFVDGSAMLRHSFIRLAFLDGWRKALSGGDEDYVFGILEERLNQLASEKGQLCLTIPIACIECNK